MQRNAQRGHLVQEKPGCSSCTRDTAAHCNSVVMQERYRASPHQTIPGRRRWGWTAPINRGPRSASRKDSVCFTAVAKRAFRASFVWLSQLLFLVSGVARRTSLKNEWWTKMVCDYHVIIKGRLWKLVVPAWPIDKGHGWHSSELIKSQRDSKWPQRT